MQLIRTWHINIGILGHHKKDIGMDKQKGIVIRVENLLRTNCNREMRQTWNKEATIHICDENCPGDIIRFCNNAFKHCNDHLRNTGVLGHHKKDIESLSGMVRQAKVHGNACLESVVVMRTLDWKLHAFDVLSEYDEAKWNCYRTIAVNLLFVKTAIVSRKREELNRLRPEEPNTSSG
ncbi:hypothetical protein V6N12_063428 [Hibiscus sabdariffa]|uniref:Uncharacterized protein n=1 Tax=Hibiscus sabdariffa TaxID=183260 RepID=A0ABR2FBT8_9ROSI